MTTAILVGLVINILLQVWVQPRWFREDSARQVTMLTGQFTAQLKTLETVVNGAEKTLDEAVKFLRGAEMRFADCENRVKYVEHLTNELQKTTHKIAELLSKLDQRLACVESVCAERHENTMRVHLDRIKEERR